MDTNSIEHDQTTIVVYRGSFDNRDCTSGCEESIPLDDLIALENVTQTLYYEVTVAYLIGNIAGAPRVQKIGLIGHPSVPREFTLEAQEISSWRFSWKVRVQ